MSVHVDIHCHSSSKAFMSGMSHPSKNLYRRFPFTIEHPIYRLLRKPIAKFSNIRLETQSAFDQLFEGGVRVAFVSVTPMEKAFTMLNPLAKGTKNELLKSFLKEPSNYRDGFIGSKAMNALTGFKVSDIDSIKGSVYHIYQELFLPEIDFLLSEKDKKSPDGRYTVRFPKNYSELKQYLLDPSNLNILLTVEGAHCFGEASTLPVLQAGITNTHSTDTHNVAYANQMAANIRDFRTRYPVPLFSVGLCHHFWNGLAGHARSLASLLEAVLNQDEGLNGPLLDAGRMVIDELSRKEY
ncbi:MAG TPA: hypothetical protein PLP34_07115, partial [Chitinophagaceae bacterium]|nr:hypothetical protein [Chitinophagaceae bacterium]